MNNEKFGGWLNEARKQKGMTQEQLAGELNYTKQAVSKWESGKGMPNNETVSQIENILGPCPHVSAKDYEKYKNFGKLSEIKEVRQIEERFYKIIDGIKIDTMFSESVRYALHDLLWTALYCFKNYSENLISIEIDGGNQEWFYYTLSYMKILSDYEKEYLEKVEDNYVFMSVSPIKRKLEVFLNKNSNRLESITFADQISKDSFEFMIDAVCHGNMEQLYNVIPDTDTSWKSSFIAAAYKLSEQLYAVYYATCGLDIDAYI